MRFPLMIVTALFLISDSGCCLNYPKVPVSGITAPEEIWNDLVLRMENGDVEGVKKLTSANGYLTIVNSTGGVEESERLRAVASIFKAWTLKPAVKVYSVGPDWMNGSISFTKAKDGWKLDEYSPASE